jgi:hypothetical protein
MQERFLSKFAMEMAIGMALQGAAEYSFRQESFCQELDLVLSGMLSTVVSTTGYMLMSAPVVFIHPRITLRNPTWSEFLATCPANAFQKVRAGDPPFSITQRVTRTRPAP